MTLVLSRRRFDDTARRFGNAVSDRTHHLWVERRGGAWSVGFVERGRWLAHAKRAAGAHGLVLYVHGYNTRQPAMFERLLSVERGLKAGGFRGAVAGFDWASDGVVYGYDYDRQDAARIAPGLVADGIRPLLAHVAGGDVSVLAHSMGCYLAAHALAGGGPRWTLRNLLFTAADVDAAQLKRQAPWGRGIAARAKRFTNYHCPHDGILRIARVVHGNRPRAGRAGLIEPARPPFHDVRCGAQYHRDVAPAARGRVVSHNWWFLSPGFFRDAALVLGGADPATLPTRRPTLGGDQMLFAGGA
ncbi:alpha/beta hydrolase [Jannaschia sp. W003]|uniref:alpha/beta hydrolase n=1 Tax=Jannaschia sp. W003 TaxID=2867012 RepID=UPI0021A6C93E|nr:alpha/beta hydrolase [Jannaschia sp. W003]UWQ21061.1 alpha/beta hydrolase [Jannaschia sp. W003]